MDGWTILKLIREALSESSNSNYVNDQLSYQLAHDAAKEINARTASITSSQTITTVSDQAEYNLNPDFQGLYLSNDDGDLFVKYYDGTSYTFLTTKPYAEVVYDNQATSVTIPDYVAIKHATTEVPNVTGTASANGNVVNGEATLTDTSSVTKFAIVSVGDAVHNTTDDTHGIVISKTSSTALITAIFSDDGTAQSWGSSDAYILVPQGRFSLIFDPPPSISGHIITVPYIKAPTPVFSPYRSYPFPVECYRDISMYAAALYKYRDKDPTLAAAYLQQAVRSLGLTGATVKKATDRNRFSMKLRGKRR